MPNRKLVTSKSFEKFYKRFTKKNIELQKAIDRSLKWLEKDAFAGNLKTHKLSGNLLGLFACSCGYDCRIIFSIQKEKEKEIILLIDIGTHNEVY